MEGEGTKRSDDHGSCGGGVDRVVHNRSVINAGDSSSGQSPNSEDPGEQLPLTYSLSSNNLTE